LKVVDLGFQVADKQRRLAGRGYDGRVVRVEGQLDVDRLSIGENQLDTTLKTPDQNNHKIFYTQWTQLFIGRAALLLTSQHATGPGQNG
jgi:hypothetical protein